jgi:putative intracellular protease/amidase
MSKTVFCAVYDDLADWEVGYLLAELRSGRFTGRPFAVRTVSAATAPVTTMGGVRVLPDLTLGDLDPADGALLVLPGSSLWDGGGGQEFADAAARFLDAGVPVAAICGATFGLARAGLLDDRAHTSAAREYLQASGYHGEEHYRDDRAVVDGDLVTAGPQSPVQFALATMSRLGLASPELVEAYEAVFHRGDAAAYPALMRASAAA